MQSNAAAAAAAAVLVGGTLVLAAAQHNKREQQALEEERVVVNRVLEFWFTEHYKDWFLAEGADRDAFDALVEREFHDLLLDVMSRDALGQLTNHRQVLANILVLDQFSRHIYRNSADGAQRIAACGELARALLERALAMELHLQCNGEELGFLLMPYRHEVPLQPARMRQVLAIVDVHERRQLRYKAHLDRFKRVSESRASELRQARPDAALQYRDEDILETVCVENAQLERKIGRGGNALIHTLAKFAQNFPGDTLLISLSGGVDSMVICDCLLHVKRADQRIVCAHVDYSNRAESHAEAAFLQRFCARNSIALYVSDLSRTGLLRGVTDREEYEEKSRNIRFDLYKEVWYTQLNKPKGELLPQVIFGHHEGDVVENVLSNAMKGKTVIELSGMAMSSQINDCVVLRPLLKHSKEFIYAYAQEFSVPYFKDTTPRWSTRGQVRNELLPCIERIYGKGFQLHLARLAEQSDETFELLLGGGGKEAFLHEILVYSSPTTTTAGEGRNGLVAFALDLAKLEHKPLFLWRIALRMACHASGVLTATDKAVKFLFDTFEKHRHSRLGWFAEMRKGIRAYVWEGRYLLVFKMDSGEILSSPAASAVESKETLELNGPGRRIGCWEVSIVDCKEDSSEETVTMQKVWDALVLGKSNVLQYRIRAATATGEGAKYQVLPHSQRVLPSIDMDLALRQVLLPVLAVAAPGKEDRHASVVVRCEWKA